MALECGGGAGAPTRCPLALSTRTLLTNQNSSPAMRDYAAKERKVKVSFLQPWRETLLFAAASSSPSRDDSNIRDRVVVQWAN